MLMEELKKQTRMIDLAVSAGQKRQSARTGFVHEEEIVPLYENFCFALALFRQKTAESVNQAKALIGRLLAFESAGNFPLYLHDYPRCHDFYMGLRIAPILIHLLRDFSSVLGELKGKIEEALKRILAQPPEKASWESRYRACLHLPIEPTPFPSSDWTEWLITAQLAGQTHFELPYDSHLQLLKLPIEIQERGEPRPHPIEWLLADSQFSPRLLRDHPHQLLSAPLLPMSYTPVDLPCPSFRKYWQGSTLHSLVAKGLVFELPEGVEMGRSDLFEASLFTDISPETEIFVEGKKATSFQLGDRITLQTPALTLHFKMELMEGSGDFFGHIFRANRPSQSCKGYEAYDWQIGLRTLRRSPKGVIQVFFL